MATLNEDTNLFELDDKVTLGLHLGAGASDGYIVEAEGILCTIDDTAKSVQEALSDIVSNATSSDNDIEDLQEDISSLQSTDNDLQSQITANKVSSNDNSITVTESDDGTDLSVNIDNETIISTDGVLSVDSSALTQYDGTEAISISNTDDVTNSKTVSLTLSDTSILSQSDSGLSATLSIIYSSTDKCIYLYGTDTENPLSTIDATDFIKDGMLDSAEYSTTNADGTEGSYVKLTFNTDAGKEDIYVDLGDIITAFNNDLQGLTLSLDGDDNEYLKLNDSNGETISSINLFDAKWLWYRPKYGTGIDYSSDPEQGLKLLGIADYADGGMDEGIYQQPQVIDYTIGDGCHPIYLEEGVIKQLDYEVVTGIGIKTTGVEINAPDGEGTSSYEVLNTISYDLANSSSTLETGAVEAVEALNNLAVNSIANLSYDEDTYTITSYDHRGDEKNSIALNVLTEEEVESIIDSIDIESTSTVAELKEDFKTALTNTVRSNYLVFYSESADTYCKILGFNQCYEDLFESITDVYGNQITPTVNSSGYATYCFGSEGYHLLFYTFLENIENLEGAFYNCDIVQIGSGLFRNCETVTNIGFLFESCELLEKVECGAFDYFTAVTNVDELFYYCIKLNSIPANLLKNSPYISSAIEMFRGCVSLTCTPDNIFNSIYLNYVNGMFYGCTGLVNITKDVFTGAPNISELAYTFAECTSLETIDSKVIRYLYNVNSLYYCFYECACTEQTLFVGSTYVSYASGFGSECFSAVYVVEGSTTYETMTNTGVDCSTYTRYEEAEIV